MFFTAMHQFAIFACFCVAACSPLHHTKRSCSADFKNVVFNSGVNSEPDFPGRFQVLQQAGVNDWIGFTLGDPSPADPNLIANQIRMVVTGDNVQSGVDLVTGSNPPQYLQLLNEPDGGFYGQPVYDPQQAVQILQPLLTATTQTLFLSPAPAYPTSDWLPQFFSACNCDDKFPVVLAHIYNTDPNAAISAIQGVINQFPSKRIWITEIGPASSADQNCNLDAQGMQNWMTQVLGFASQQAQIERVFWNSGEYGTLYPDNPAQCNPSLTNNDTTATDLLNVFAGICA